MSVTEVQFRTATFGGFQKQDVLNYIETTNQEHKAKLDALERDLKETGKDKAALEEAVSAAQGRAEEAEQQCQRLSGELDGARQEMEDLKAQLAQKEAELEEVWQSLSETEQKLAKAAPAAAAYEKVKDRTAGIELEAHCRAQVVQAEAEERVKKARQEVEQWLGKVRTGYERLRTDMDATISHACGDLERVRKTLEEISESFVNQDGALEQMAQTCAADLGHRAPDPLPLDEK